MEGMEEEDEVEGKIRFGKVERFVGPGCGGAGVRISSMSGTCQSAENSVGETFGREMLTEQ